jgi:hypothetical protein
MASFDAESIYRMGCKQYRGMLVPTEAQRLNTLTYRVWTGEVVIRGTGSILIGTDLLEDADDTNGALLDLVRLKPSGLKVKYILSGGLCSPQQRMAFLQTMLPGIEFGVEYDGYLVVYPDGYILEDPVDGALIAGPLHSATFSSVCRMVTKAITFVGTDASGRLAPTQAVPINSKKTDVEGRLTPDIEWWNANIDVLERRGIAITSLPPEIGRFTTAPVQEHPVLDDQLTKARLLNTSRLPPQLWRIMGKRLTEANAMVMGQWPPAEFIEERFQHGAQVAEEYIALAASALSPEEVADLQITVTYVFIEAALRGAVYLPGKFGSASKTYAEFLTPESIAELTVNLAGMPTPMYDVAARMILFHALGLI